MAEKITIEKHESNVFNDLYTEINGTDKNEKIKSETGVLSWINAGAGNDKITGVNKYDMLAGNEGNDTITASKAKGEVEIYGGTGNDSLTGSSYNDYISGGDGEDIIRGGKGNDILRGNTPTTETTNPDDNAKDTFLFYKGDGQDEIRDIAKDDVIKFADRTNFNGLSFVKDGDDLVISDEKKGDKITVKASEFVDNLDDVNFTLKNKSYDLEWMQSNVFDDTNSGGTNEGVGRMYNVIDGTSGKDKITTVSGIANYINAGAGDDVIKGLNAGDILAGNEGNDKIDASKAKGGVEIYGGEGNDSLTGSSHSDWIAGNEGNDLIKGGKGNDTLLGGDHYTTKSGSGNDTIYGGKGNDLIAGGDGADTYVFSKGDGVDTILGANIEDTINFSDRTNFNGLTFAKNGDDLVISDEKKGDKITVRDYDDVNFALKNKEYDLEWKQSNVTVENTMYNIVDGTDVNDKITAISGISNWINAGTGNDKITGKNAGDMLAGNEGNDTITASKANGGVEIYGGTGNDSLIGSAYNDYISGGDGEDIIRGGKGNDILRGNTPTTETTNPDDNAKDTFLFYKGDGQDEIRDIAKDDVIKFANVNSFTQKLVGDDLVISYNGGNDSITITDYLSNTEIQDFTIITKNGKEYSADVEALKEGVSAWLSENSFTDIATGLTNADEQQVANLAAVFEQNNFQAVL